MTILVVWTLFGSSFHMASWSYHARIILDIHPSQYKHPRLLCGISFRKVCILQSIPFTLRFLYTV
jgi:hypothetical protein